MKIEVKGPIISSSDQWIYDWFGMEATSPKKVSSLIKQAKGEELEVEINSGGGSVFAGSEIYTALKSYEGNVVVKIVGLAASAASVIAMAGNKTMMSPTGQIMIHNASSYASGDYREMEKGAEMLKNVNASISNAYRIKTGMSQEELLALMDKETWMTAQQALDNKFVDGIMFEEETQLVASADHTRMLPPEVINKLRNEFKKEPEKNPRVNDKRMQEIENKLKEIDLILALR